MPHAMMQYRVAAGLAGASEGDLADISGVTQCDCEPTLSHCPVSEPEMSLKAFRDGSAHACVSASCISTWRTQGRDGIVVTGVMVGDLDRAVHIRCNHHV